MEATREKYDYKKAKERKKKFVRYKEGAAHMVALESRRN